MKTLKEKSQQIKELKKHIENVICDRDKLYESAKDFKLSHNKTLIVMNKMKDLNSIIKSYENKILKIEAQL